MRKLLVAGLCLLSLSTWVNADEQPLAAIGEPVVYLVLFGSDSAELTETARTILEEVVREYEMRKQNASNPVTMYVTGRHDTSGTAEYAEQISRERAENVRDYLISAGIPAEALEVAWTGERQLAIPTRDGVAEPANRHVEINFHFPPN